MDSTKTIEYLRRQKEKLERVIASPEGLQPPAVPAFPQKERRGRKSVSLEERRELSIRMKSFWEERRKQRRPWS